MSKAKGCYSTFLKIMWNLCEKKPNHNKSCHCSLFGSFLAMSPGNTLVTHHNFHYVCSYHTCVSEIKSSRRSRDTQALKYFTGKQIHGNLMV